MENPYSEKFRFSSCIEDDVWHPQSDEKSYEWWYFDALSDDGSEALTIIFLDNFVFSPNSQKSKSADFVRRPAIFISYCKDGKPVYRTVNEYQPDEFSADTEKPFCQIEKNNFRLKSVPYGLSYLLETDALLRKGKRFRASLEWLLVESDLMKTEKIFVPENSRQWNVVAPRADVTGKIEIFDAENSLENVINFRGTGYHDHHSDAGWLAKIVHRWQWGRAHFSDATVFFYRWKEIENDTAQSKIFLIQNKSLTVLNAECEESDLTKNIFGLKYPQKLIFKTTEGWQLTVKQTRLIDSNFFYLRFLCETEIENPQGEKHHSFALSEQVVPKKSSNRLVDWLLNMKIGI